MNSLGSLCFEKRLEKGGKNMFQTRTKATRREEDTANDEHSSWLVQKQTVYSSLIGRNKKTKIC